MECLQTPQGFAPDGGGFKATRRHEAEHLQGELRQLWHITAGGAILKERTGSWSTIFYICGVCQLLAGLFFGAFAEVERAKVEDKKD